MADQDATVLAAAGPDARLRPLSILAHGGMADVVLAEQASLGRTVAVKVAARRSGVGTEVFAAETLVTAGLEHPGIVPVHDAGDDFMVMRCVRGRTLAQLIDEDGTTPAAIEAHVRVLLRVCDTLRFAHSRGIIHRDLKPANIMVGDFGEVVLLDWGLAVQVAPTPDGRRRAPTPERVEACAGTPAYMPPEVADADGARLSAATDVFLLGATLWHILTGRPPYRAASARRSVQAAWRMSCPTVATLNPAAPEALVALAGQAMARQGDDRGDCATFAAGLAAWLARASSLRSADEARDRARRLLAAGGGWAELDAAVAACDRCLGVDRSDAQAAAMRAQAQAGRARLALAAGDLQAATAAAAASGDAALVATVADRRERARRRDRHQRRLRTAGLAAAVAAAALLIAAVIHLGIEASRADGARARTAQALVAASDIALGDGSLAGCERAIALAERAAQADPPAGQAALRRALAAGMRRGAAAGDAAYVRALAGRLRAVPGSATLSVACSPLVVDVETRPARRAAATRQEHAFTAELIVRRAARLASDPALQAAAAARLASWPLHTDAARHADDQRLVDGLLSASEAAVRRTAILGLAARPDLLDAGRLQALAGDRDPDVAALATNTLTHRAAVAR